VVQPPSVEIENITKFVFAKRNNPEEIWHISIDWVYSQVLNLAVIGRGAHSAKCGKICMVRMVIHQYTCTHQLWWNLVWESMAHCWV